MYAAITDLTLDHLYIIIPGDKSFLLDKKISICGLDALQTIFDHDVLR